MRSEECPGSQLNSGEIIRPMVIADLSAVHELECFAQTSPWSPEHFLAELDNPCSHIDLCWRNGELAGFLCWWLIAGEMQIQNVATAPAFRRQGVAACLLEHVFAQGRGSGFDSAWLEVRISNVPAIALYERFGFAVAGRRPGYYADGEDALVMCFKTVRSEE